MRSPLRLHLLPLALVALSGPVVAQTKSKLPPPIIPQGFGVNIHFVAPQPGQLARLREIGFRYARMDFKWQSIEAVKGTYDFSAYDKLTAALKAHGALPFYILDYGNPLYDGGLAPHTEAGRAAYARFAAAAAEHFRGQGVIWEIWNEPNLTQFWKPSANAENYAALAIKAARAIRAADPDACILAPGTSKFPWPYFETLFRSGLLREIDAISVHPYRDNYPESSSRDYLRLRQLIAANTPPGAAQTPIVCSEWGYSTYTKGVSEEMQAVYLARQWLSNLAAGVNLSIYYDLMDDGDKGTEKEHRFGTVHFQTLEPKPVFEAARSLIADLNGYRFRHRLKTDSEHQWKLLFQRDTDFALVTWSSDPRASLADQTPRTRFVRPSTEYEALKRTAAVQYEAAALAATPLNPAQLQITLTNPEATPAEITLKVGSNTKSFRLAPAAEERVTVSLPIQLAQTTAAGAPGASSAVSLPVEVSWNGRPVQHLPPVTLAPAYSLAFEVNPEADGVEIRVKNLLGEPFRGKLRVVSLGSNTETALDVPAAGNQIVRMDTDLTKPLQLIAVDEKGVEAVRTRGQRFLPLPGFPAAVTQTSPLLAVEHVEDVPTPKQLLAPMATAGESPAPLALALPYSANPGRIYTQARPAQPDPIPASATELLLWVHAANDGMKLRSRFKDATGQSFQVDLGELNWQGWKRIRIPFYDGATGSWGGANDGIPHLPLHWEGILLVDGSRKPEGKNQVLLAAPYYVLAE